MDNAVVQHFESASALRGFHVYKNTQNWGPVKWQELIFHCEFDNNFDIFAVTGKKLLPGKLAPSIVGYVYVNYNDIYLVCFAIWCYHNCRGLGLTFKETTFSARWTRV